jgi:hypothetical protein
MRRAAPGRHGGHGGSAPSAPAFLLGKGGVRGHSLWPCNTCAYRFGACACAHTQHAQALLPHAQAGGRAAWRGMGTLGRKTLNHLSEALCQRKGAQQCPPCRRARAPRCAALPSKVAAPMCTVRT